jgi:hypothetical protein
MNFLLSPPNVKDIQMYTESSYCINCGSPNTLIEKNGYAHWYHYGEDHMCRNCYKRLLRSEKNAMIQAVGKRIKVYLADGTYREFDNVSHIYKITERSIL